MPTINLNGPQFSVLTLEPGSPLPPEWPGDVLGDDIIGPGDSGTILGPIVELPGWPNLNNLHVWNPEPFNPNLGPPPQFVIPVQLPNYLDTVVLPPLSPGPSATDLYGNFQPMAVVPEPATIALVMMGCAAAAVSKRFRRKKH